MILRKIGLVILLFYFSNIYSQEYINNSGKLLGTNIYNKMRMGKYDKTSEQFLFSDWVNNLAKFYIYENRIKLRMNNTKETVYLKISDWEPLTKNGVNDAAKADFTVQGSNKDCVIMLYPNEISIFIPNKSTIYEFHE